MWSAHFFVTHIHTGKISSWNGPAVHVCCFMLARASTKTFVSRVRKTAKRNLLLPKNSLAGSLVSRGITVYAIQVRSAICLFVLFAFTLDNQRLFCQFEFIHTIWHLYVEPVLQIKSKSLPSISQLIKDNHTAI